MMNAAAVRSPILPIAVVDKKFDLSAAVFFAEKQLDNSMIPYYLIQDENLYF